MYIKAVYNTSTLKPLNIIGKKMTTHTKQNNTTRLSHNIPEDCIGLILEESWDILNRNNIIMDVKPSNDPMRLYNGNFASVYEQVPFIDEKKEHDGVFTNIRNDEYGDTIDETAKTVLTRLGVNLADTYYWAVYLHELDAPNDQELTKVFSNSPDDHKGEGKFAGIGWHALKDDSIDPTWATETKDNLLTALFPITLWLNKKVMHVIIRDANTGLKIVDYEAFNTEAGGFNFKLKQIIVGTYVKRFRARENYDQLIATQMAGTHILPTEHQDILTDSTKALLAERGLLIRVSEPPKDFDFGARCDKFFGVARYFPKAQTKSEAFKNVKYEDISEEILDRNNTIDGIAVELMNSMDGDMSNMSYWPVYVYEDKEAAHEWGHSKFYTTDINKLPVSGGNLVGIGLKYNHGILPDSMITEDYQRDQKQHVIDKLALLSDEEKSQSLLEWQEMKRDFLAKSLVDAETNLNNKVLYVGFRDAATGDAIYSYAKTGYLKDKTAFNAKIQAEISRVDEYVANQDKRVQAYLMSASNKLS